MLIKGIIASANYPRSTTSYESIATVTVGAGGSSSITFSSIPSTYKHLQIRYSAITSGTQDVQFRLNSDTGANYAYHYLYGSGTAAAAGATTSAVVGYAGYSTGTNPQGAVIDLLDYQNTNKYKTVRTLSGVDNNGSGYIFLASSLWQNTTAVNTVTLLCNSGGFNQYSQFALYGVKG